jgi:hypothetical protein
VAYATQNTAAEHRRLMSWSNSWAQVHQYVAQVLENYLKDWEDLAGFTMLEIEVEADEYNDDLAPDWDYNVE